MTLIRLKRDLSFRNLPYPPLQRIHLNLFPADLILENLEIAWLGFWKQLILFLNPSLRILRKWWILKESMKMVIKQTKTNLSPVTINKMRSWSSIIDFQGLRRCFQFVISSLNINRSISIKRSWNTWTKVCRILPTYTTYYKKILFNLNFIHHNSF